jgi:hypothetical protein
MKKYANHFSHEDEDSQTSGRENWGRDSPFRIPVRLHASHQQPHTTPQEFIAVLASP